jgi:DUF1680 family protein
MQRRNQTTIAIGEMLMKDFSMANPVPSKGEWPQTTFTSANFHPGSFIAQKRAVACKTTLHYQFDALKRTGRYDCFKLHWKPIYDEPLESWPISKQLFWDSDMAKWIEGAY